MATLAPPGIYAVPTDVTISATAAFTGRAVEMKLISPVWRELAVFYGLAPESMRDMPGSTRLAGSFGARRGRRFLNQATR
jgi:hypothetical protein